MSNDSESHPDVVCSPCIQHPHRPVIVWAAGSFLFAFNLATSQFEAYRLEEHTEPIRSIDFCPKSSHTLHSNDSIAGCWITAGEDKQVTIYEDETFKIRERFLFFKCPAVVRYSQNGSSLIWGDKFGELYQSTICELRKTTQRVVSSSLRHLQENKKDSFAISRCKDILNKFKLYQSENIQFLAEETNGTVRTKTLSTNHSDNIRKFDSLKESHNDELDVTMNTSVISNENVEKTSKRHASSENDLMEAEDDVLIPFAGHLAQITALEVSRDRKLLLSGDKDEKIRVGSLEHLFVTTGFGLGHTEFITALSCPTNDPEIAASASGDRTLRLWDLSSGALADGEGCVELSTVKLEYFPSSIQFSQERRSFLIGCEGFSGVLEIPLIEVATNTSLMAKFRLDCENIRRIQLPSIPMAILPSFINPSHLEYKAFSFLSSVDPVFQSSPVFFWTDREGRLHPPVSLVSGMPLSSDSTWEGVNIGASVPVATIRWWKHNREPNAITEEEKLSKRLKHVEPTEKSSISPSSNPLVT